MNVLFVSPDNPMERGGGGIASYINKISKLLLERGHSVVVLTFGPSDGQITKDGITFYTVKRQVKYNRVIKILRLPKLADLMNARKLGSRFRAIKNFVNPDVVQIANFKFVGLFIKQSDTFRKIVRISSSRVLVDSFNKKRSRTGSSLTEKIEVYIMKHSDLVYGPSRTIADYFRNKYSIPVQVIRSPMPSIEIQQLKKPPAPIPGKFFICFGKLNRLKGIYLIAKALEIAKQSEPGIKVIMAGSCKEQTRQELVQIVGSDALIFTGRLEKPELFYLVQHAEAALLPSLIDNLPNTAIESLSLDVPVITCRGSSVDELIIHGKNGEVFDRENIEAFSDIMIKIWRGQHSYKKGALEKSPVFAEMKPDRAVQNLIALGLE